MTGYRHGTGRGAEQQYPSLQTLEQQEEPERWPVLEQWQLNHQINKLEQQLVPEQWRTSKAAITSEFLKE
jgi:hypothetical protein